MAAERRELKRKEEKRTFKYSFCYLENNEGYFVDITKSIFENGHEKEQRADGDV